MLRHSGARTPHQPSHRLEVPETAAQQDEIIRGIAAIEEEELDAQQADVIKSNQVIALMMTISRFHRWLLDHTIERPVTLASLHHSHHR